MNPATTTSRGPRGTFTIFHVPVGGQRIPMRIHWTLLLAIPYFAVGFLPQIIDHGDGANPVGSRVGFLLGALLAVGLFAAVALHELAHTFIGMRLGAKVRGITLMFLGGVSDLERAPARPSGEVLMAAAGPAMSLVLAALGWAIARSLHGVPRNVIGLFAQINLAIALFNLLPAFPLDGGRVLRGALSYSLGQARATAIASVLGRVVAVLLGLAGLYTGNLFVTLIAVFIFFGAGAEQRAELLEAALDRVAVAQVMEPFVTTLRAAATVEEAAERFAGTRRDQLLVENDGGHVVGLLTQELVRAVPYAYRARMTVASVMRESPAPVSPGDSVSAALRRMNEQVVEELPVVDGGALVGVLRLADVAKLLKQVEGRSQPR